MSLQDIARNVPDRYVTRGPRSPPVLCSLEFTHVYNSVPSPPSGMDASVSLPSITSLATEARHESSNRRDELPRSPQDARRGHQAPTGADLRAALVMRRRVDEPDRNGPPRSLTRGPVEPHILPTHAGGR